MDHKAVHKAAVWELPPADLKAAHAAHKAWANKDKDQAAATVIPVLQTLQATKVPILQVPA